MSEYQYYEFQAIDRPLDEADRKALRSLSSRAQITATSFTNHYQWGDFKGSPRQLMERWFDLHLHIAYWGTRRLMIRLPKRLIDQDRLDALLMGTDLAELIEAGDNLILDIRDEGEDALGDDGDDGSRWLAAMAPLRAELLSGDWRLAYLLWLTGVANGSLRDEAPEPLPGIAPLSGGLQAFADFLRIDPDLVQAAAEAPTDAENRKPSSAELHTAIAAMPESRKTALLLKLAEGDPHVAAELRNGVRRALSAEDPRKTPTLRSAASLTAPRRGHPQGSRSRGSGAPPCRTLAAGAVGGAGKTGAPDRSSAAGRRCLAGDRNRSRETQRIRLRPRDQLDRRSAYPGERRRRDGRTSPIA